MMLQPVIVASSEVDALKSMETSLEDCKFVYCEVHEDMIGDSESVLPAALLHNRGFTEIERVYELSESHYILKATK